ncbi:MAG: DUF4282 domain-containing protein [Anaerolineaceae bacterium]
MDDFLNFQKLITPSIIKTLFWILSALCFVAGIVLIATSFGDYGSGAPTFLIGLCIALLGPIFSRIICEIIFVIFQIHENTLSLKPAKKTIKQRGEPKNNRSQS